MTPGWVFIIIVAYVVYRWATTDRGWMDWDRYFGLYVVAGFAFIFWLEPRIG